LQVATSVCVYKNDNNNGKLQARVRMTLRIFNLEEDCGYLEKSHQSINAVMWKNKLRDVEVEVKMSARGLIGKRRILIEMIKIGW
jgi:hypothetical protein